MDQIPELDVPSARARLDEGKTLFVDIRDPHTRSLGHIPGSHHLTNDNFEAFLSETAKDQPIVVYCYHGNSSLMAAAHLLENGFQDVKSMAGGYTEWEATAPAP